MEKLTPMLKQYMDVKKEYQDALVMFRLGDFYELFFDDAKIASYELDLVLTKRAAGEGKFAPMSGVPYHAVSQYIQKLVYNGHKVAIVEQMEDPAIAVGLVKRDVVRVITPGTVVDELSEDQSSVRIASLSVFAGKYTLVMVDLASGESECMAFYANDKDLKEAIVKHRIKELVISSSINQTLLKTLREFGLTLSYCDVVDEHLEYKDLLSLIKDDIKIEGFYRLLNYLLITQKRSVKHLQKVQDETDQLSMHLDYASIQNLELIEALNNQSKQASLFSFLDECQSTMGSRVLKQWIIKPLRDIQAIQLRQSQIQYLVLHHMEKETYRSALKQIYDMERIIAKISFKSANPSDIVRLIKTLNQVPIILKLCDYEAFRPYQVNQLDELRDLLNKAIDENSNATLKDGFVFKTGYNAELDEYRRYQTEGQSWLLEFENQEKERTQIKNLKLGYNRVFGYYIEVSKGSLNLVKEEYGYTRRQTLSTGERYITQTLKEKEEIILHAADKAYRLELSLFNELLETLQESLREMQELAKTLATIDVLQALATISENPKYVLPEFHTGFELNIIEGRHPLLELKTSYVSNSTNFNPKESLHLLTGPNMGGKSTYMRQVALICIMGQMGMYIPADSADLSLLDAIYTRMGASDDILQGQSTFMVEMMEANNALQKATKQSLILFDEIGRGTSTYDGMALAQSIVEYIATAIQCKTIFSTHYHELTNLETVLETLKNTHVEVYEDKGDVCFLYRVKHGSADKSYGVNVAKIAHLPNSVLERAGRLLSELESKKRVVQQTLDIVEVIHIPTYIQQIEDILKSLEIDETTPLEALSYLNDFKSLLKESLKHGKN